MSTQAKNTFSSGMIPIRVTNTSAETIPPNSCVAIGETSALTTGVMERAGSGVGKGRFTIPVRKPDAEAVDTGSRALFLFTLDFPIPPEKSGYATASFPVWSRLTCSSCTRGMAVSPVPGSWDLQEGAGFFGLVDAQTIGSQKYAFVVFDGGGVLLGFQLTSDGYLGTETATADIYRLNGPVFDGIVAEDASVYDPSKWLAGATSGYRGLCTRQGGKFYVNQSACEIPGV